MQERASKKALIRLVFQLAVMAILSRFVLNVLNQYIDSTPPSQGAMVVKGIGKYYQPFRVDYLSGESELLKRVVRVPVLPEVAANTDIGTRVQVVVGNGLFRKSWSETKETYDKYSDRNFRTGYVTIFVLVFVVCSVVCLKVASRFGQARAAGAYCSAVAVGSIMFYLF